MQTFLPYPNFEASAKTLDRQRLGKQRLEAWQILNALQGLSRGWRNHPAVKMWSGHEYSLCIYGMAICSEWKKRGYQDSLWDRFFVTTALYRGNTSPPSWFGDERFHASHRSNLIRKNPAFYRDQFPDTEAGLEYVWPV